MRADRLRAVVIGARCRRQGIGHHLARFLHAEGVEVAAICGTTDATVAAAADALAPILGSRPAGYVDVGTMLAQEAPDVCVIASPDETHAAYLELCLGHRVHVLCEKPVCWGGPAPDDEALRLGEALKDAGLHLVVNAQWPLTLPAYRALFPAIDPARARRFRMRMSPASRGRDMLPATLPHPISLLLAAAPDGPTHIEAVRHAWGDGADDALTVTFTFVHAQGRIDAEIEIVSVPAQPRPAGYGFDDSWAAREVDLDTYRMRLRDGQRTVPLPDPTPLLVRSFLDRVRGAPPVSLDPSVDPGMAHLLALAAPEDARAETESP
ncbi:MAG: Gfo/Idh/MocA family oxidoreductase [Planctomycetota bacterium]|nr:Gfo/Idh/MocA family oxidoreductase [Planctomycetota bacterium]